MPKKTMIWVIIGCVTMYTLPNIFYMYNFQNYPISTNPSNWGVYGDFIGGSINPLLTIANIIALVYLTYTVSHVEDNRAIENIKTQKIITLNQMRYDTVKELSANLNTMALLAFTNEAQANHNKSIFLSTLVISFRYGCEDLFKELFTKTFDDEYLMPLLDDLKIITEYYGDCRDNKKNITPEIKDKLASYYNRQANFINQINNFILLKMSH